MKFNSVLVGLLLLVSANARPVFLRKTDYQQQQDINDDAGIIRKYHLSQNEDGKWIPNYPKQYTVEGVFSIPYANIHQPVLATTDHVNQKQAVSFYDDLDRFVYDISNNVSYEIYTKMDHKECKMVSLDPLGPAINAKKQADNGDGGGVNSSSVPLPDIHDESDVPPSNENRNMFKVQFLPDLRPFSYDGVVECPLRQGGMNGLKCHIWTLENKKLNLHSNYIFYAEEKTLMPVLYSMVGYDLPFGSHYDVYKVHYTKFTPGTNQSLFMIPASCRSKAHDEAHTAKHTHHIEEISHLFAGTHHEHSLSQFDQFIKTHNKVYGDESDDEENKNSEYYNRHHVFRTNLAVIGDLNKKHPGVTFAINHMADLTSAERSTYSKGYLPRKTSNGGPNNNNNNDDDEVEDVVLGSNEKKVYHELSGEVLPEAFDWRNYGAVSQVKDQGTCGSCWAFSGVQTVESHVFISTREMISLSEQQIIDCAWDYGNNGCDGGNQETVFSYIRDNSGIMSLHQYPYLNQNGYCKADPKHAAARVKGTVYIPIGDEALMKDALFSKGPIAIAYDASLESMSFYSRGVYDDKACKTSPEDLDHAILCVGYGVSKSNEEYWICKNSWSTYWGNMGYFKIARNKNNRCGLASDAVYPLV